MDGYRKHPAEEGTLGKQERPGEENRGLALSLMCACIHVFTRSNDVNMCLFWVVGTWVFVILLYFSFSLLAKIRILNTSI